MFKLFYLFIICCITITIISADTMNVISSASVTEIQQLPYDQNIIHRHLASILIKRASSKIIPNNPQLLTFIVAEIKARIHTDITSKISASVKCS